MNLTATDLRSIRREASARFETETAALAAEQGKTITVRTGLRAGSPGEAVF